jgi:DNA-binding CsgD family transcriptional regulator/PAS domain-containing protein
MDARERMLALLRHVYAAAADEGRWPAVLELLADEFRGGVSGFHYRVGVQGRVQSAQFVRLDPALHAAIHGYYATRNPWVRLTQPLFRPGVVIASDQFLSLSQLRRTEYYDGILRPAGVVHSFGACILKRGDDVCTFTVVRSGTAGPYELSELKRVRALLPHLQRAVQVNRRLSQLWRDHVGLADGLDQLRHGVILINSLGRVIFSNRAARAIIDQQDGLAIHAGQLLASARADRFALHALLDEAMRTAAGDGFGAGGAVAVARPSLRRSFLVLVTPLRLPLELDDPRGCAAVFISDPEEREETVGEVARRLHGLSASEARVANALAATGSLGQAAAELRISRETARWHIKRIYRKTGTASQVALLRRLAGGRAQLKLDTAPRRSRLA